MAGKPKSMRLWQELVLTLAVKAVLLTIIWAVWFSAPESRSLSVAKVASQVFSSPFQQEQAHDAVH